MMQYRAEVVSWPNLTATLDAASAEGWTVVSLQLHETGNEPVVYVVWSKPV